MKIKVCLVGLLLPLLSTAQGAADTATRKHAANDNLNADHYVSKIKSGDDSFSNYYKAAGCYALLNKPADAFFYLKEAIQRGAKGEDVITDTDFEPLKQDTAHWKEIDTLLKKQYSAQNPSISNLDLGYELWLMWIEDQRFRTLKKNYKLKVEPKADRALHDLHLAKLKKIITGSGWPKYSEVGIEGGDAVFFVFQHDDAKNMKPVLPLFIAAAKAGDADLTKAAMMIDRYLAYTENVQIYGTQAYRKIEPGQNRNEIPLTLYPIADEEHLLQRRSAIGMGDFKLNCERLGVIYTPVEMRSNYKAITIKKKWIKAGYIL